MTKPKDPKMLGANTNQMGAFPSASAVPPAGTKQFAFALAMAATDIHDTSDFLDLAIEVQQRGQWVEVARYSKINGKPWQGGPTQAAPSLTYVFPTVPGTLTPVPPDRIRAIAENGVNGIGSEAIWNEGDGTFA